MIVSNRTASFLINQPRGIVVDKKGIVYVSNVGLNTIARIFPNGTVATWIFNTGVLNQPGPMAFDNQWANLYIANRAGQSIVRVVMATGVATTFFTHASYIFSPTSLSIGWTDQNIYIAPSTGLNEIRFGPLPATTAGTWGVAYACTGLLADRLNQATIQYCSGASTTATSIGSQIIQTGTANTNNVIWGTYGCNPTQTVWDPFGNMWMVGMQGICNVLSGLNVTCNPPIGTSLAFGRNATCTVVPFWIYPGATVIYTVVRAGLGGGTVSLGSMTFTSMVPQTFRFQSFSPPGSADITFNLVATGQFQNYIPPPLFSFITSSEQLIIRCFPYGNGTIFWNQNISCVVAPTAAPINGLVTLVPTFFTNTDGGRFITQNGVTQWDFTSTLAQNFTLSAPPSGGGNMSVSYIVTGLDQLQYAVFVPSNNFTLRSPTQMAMRCGPGPYLSNTRITTCTVTPGSVPQYNKLTVLLSKSGVGTGIFNVPSLFFMNALPQNFTFQANSFGPISLYATPSNVDGSQYWAPPPVELQITNCSVKVTCDPVNGSSLRFNQNSTCIVYPNCVPPTGSFTVVIALVGAGGVFPNSLTFFTNVSQTFVYMAPIVNAFPSITFPMTGLDSGAFVQAGMLQWTVQQSQLNICD